MGTDRRYVRSSRRMLIEDFIDFLLFGFVHTANLQAASTPGVSLSPSIPLKAYTKPRRNPKKARGPIASTELLLHSSAHPKLDYTAREEEAVGASALLKHYVGVYDPVTGKLEVMEARRMVVRGVVRAHQATVDDQVAMVIIPKSRLEGLLLIWGFAEHERTTKQPRPSIRYEES